MTDIEITCIGSNALYTNTSNIFSGGNVTTVKFVFNDEWVNFPNKSAVFYNTPKETSVQLLNSQNVATIPAEMLANKGKLSIGVIGTNANGGVKTSKVLTYIVNQGAVTDDMETTSCTPDIWLQLLTIVKHNQTVVDAMNLTVDESQLPNKANKDLSNVTWTTLQSKGITRVQSGTYTGTGVYGENNKNTLSFGFTPKIVIIDGFKGIYLWGNGAFGFHTYNDNYVENIVTISGNAMSWYVSCDSSMYKNAYNQLNESNVTYYYVALG